MKDEISIFAQTKQMEKYEDVYGGESATAGAAKATVGKYVIDQVYSEYNGVTKFGVTTKITKNGTADADIELTTTDWKQTGTIEYEGGVLAWKTLSENNGNSTPAMPTADASGANAPSLVGITNKTYVTWTENEENGVGAGEYTINDTQTTQPADWYDYSNGKWANIKTTANGLTAYWVWIPRFEYVVPTATSKTQIDVKFIGTNVTSANKDEGYTVHPAFTFNGNELSGIWVAKFEASSNDPSLNDGGNKDGTQVQVLPTTTSWRKLPTTQIFTVCRNMTGEGGVLQGSTINSHMMKNIEWGAVAILSQSQYGVYNPSSKTGTNGDSTTQVWNNPNSSYKTGSVSNLATGKDASNAETASCDAYNVGNGPKGSTTGTVYGVYDMAGGTNEYVTGCFTGYENSKFGVTAGDSTYVDIYIGTTTEYAIIGDATKETNGWNGDFANFVFSSYPVFVRGGGYYNNGDDAGIFYFSSSSGNADVDGGFRPVLCGS